MIEAMLLLVQQHDLFVACQQLLQQSTFNLLRALCSSLRAVCHVLSRFSRSSRILRLFSLWPASLALRAALALQAKSVESGATLALITEY